MKVGLLQYDVLRDREANLQKAEAFLEKNQCELLLLPELAMGGYLFESRGFTWRICMSSLDTGAGAMERPF